MSFIRTLVRTLRNGQLRKLGQIQRTGLKGDEYEHKILSFAFS